MIDKSNPPPPPSKDPKRGEWDKTSGIAPIWREYKWYEGRPWWQWLVGFASVLGAIVGVLEFFA